MQFELTILGCNGAIPAFNRHPTSQVVNHNGSLFLVDCGEGTQFQMIKYAIKRGRLDNIFISHLHGDHFFGLVALLTSFNLNWREHPLNLYGPPALMDIVNLHFKHSETTLRYDIHFHPIIADKARVIYEDNALSVETIVLKHRLPTTGFLFREKPNLRKIIPAKVLEHNIPFDQINDIKRGDDFTTESGLVISNKELTLDPHPARSYAYCSDTAYTESYLEQINGVDLLYHEATFIQAHAERATETFHSTTKQAAHIAKTASVKKLVIGHFSARYENLEPLLFEAKEVFANTELAEEGKAFVLEAQKAARS
ncbi:MAG: ribonuclease Z [Chitinophagales bacterium]